MDLLKYKFTILYVAIFFFVTLANAMVLAFEHVSFADLKAEDWLIITCGVVSSLGTTLMAFMQQHLRKYLGELFDNQQAHDAAVPPPSDPPQSPQPQQQPKP